MMFLHRLTDDQKSSFLALATKMLLADGKVAPEEERLLDNIRAEFGLDVKANPEHIHGAVPAEIFNTRESRITAAVGFLTMGYIDNQLHVDENSAFDEVCTTFGFSKTEIADMQDWARRHADMLGELDTFIAKG